MLVTICELETPPNTFVWKNQVRVVRARGVQERQHRQHVTTVCASETVWSVYQRGVLLLLSVFQKEGGVVTLSSGSCTPGIETQKFPLLLDLSTTYCRLLVSILYAFDIAVAVLAKLRFRSCSDGRQPTRRSRAISRQR
jgi:hypothetical protein